MAFLEWLESLSYAQWVRESPSLLAFPSLLFIHTLGMALVAGGSALGLRHGVYWKSGETRMSNVYLSILRAIGVPTESFADSTGTAGGPVFGRVAG